MDVGLIFDWLWSSEGGDLLAWWLLVTLAGVTVWPLLFRVMGGLPDRGYTLARAAGLMLVGFVFWFLASLGLLRNTPGGMLVAWGVVLALSLTAFLRWEERPSLRAWFRDHRALVIVTEALFALLFVAWAAYRAHNPELLTAEKPMEIMFLNSIRASETFPPNDAWLAGYAISYYYFGYLIMAMLADLGGVASAVAFNMMIALLFALAGIGALGVVYNMVRAASERTLRRPNRALALLSGGLALCLLVLMGNLGAAFVELPYRGYASGLPFVDADYFDFWDLEERAGTRQAVDAQGNVIESVPDFDRDNVPDWDDGALPFKRFASGVVWRYSRVAHDRDLAGEPINIQPITEFPNFSFVFSDNHPHVLALPFVVLAVGLALNLVLGGRDLRRVEVPLYAVWVGGLVFMNSWDAAYIVLLVGADVLRRLIRRGTGWLTWEDVWGAGRFALAIFGLTVLFYLPWIISFTSQASGVLPNVIFPTPWQQFFLQFGTFLVILTVFSAVEAVRAGPRFNWGAGLLAVTFAASMTVVVWLVLVFRDWGRDLVRYPVFRVTEAQATLGDLLPDILERRLVGLPTELWLLALVFLVVGRLFPRTLPADAHRKPHAITYSPATGFALLLVAAGVVLTFVPDFVYLHDHFAVRINTVFKLYYQGWVMFSLASGFAVWSVLSGLQAHRPPEVLELVARAGFGIAALAFVAAGMAFPLLGTYGRALVETGRVDTRARIEQCDDTPGTTCPALEPLTLDSAATMLRASPDEYPAIECFQALDLSGEHTVITEAPYQGGYAPAAGRTTGRVSALTGLPTLMGWTGHEGQWRGDTYPRVTDRRWENGQLRDRVSDAQDLLVTQDWDRAWQVIDRYDVDYVAVGSAEYAMATDLAGGDTELLQRYEEGLQKFADEFKPVCQSGALTIYRVQPN
jgi:YYY domain-containing protein